MRIRIVILTLLTLSLAACSGSTQKWPATPLSLATFSENGVTVNIDLIRDANGQDSLSATFIPSDAGGYLYSMNTPREGVNGLGRPTLVEVPPGSKIQATGGLIESILPVPDQEEAGLLKYPDGPVTLRLPILLPDGEGWTDEKLSITYMACSGVACLPPVEGKLIDIHVPGRDTK